MMNTAQQLSATSASDFFNTKKKQLNIIPAINFLGMTILPIELYCYYTLVEQVYQFHFVLCVRNATDIVLTLYKIGSSCKFLGLSIW